MPAHDRSSSRREPGHLSPRHQFDRAAAMPRRKSLDRRQKQTRSPSAPGKITSTRFAERIMPSVAIVTRNSIIDTFLWTALM